MRSYFKILVILAALASFFHGAFQNAFAQIPENALPSLPTSQKEHSSITGDFSDLDKKRTTFSTKVIDVINPLTLQLSNKEIAHLTGIDIPDLTPYEPGTLAQTAQKILKSTLVGETVQLYQTKNKKIGRKNRMGQFVYHAEHIDTNTDKAVWVQALLVRLGLARVRSNRSNPEMIRQLYRYEAQARDEKLGLWAFPQYDILTVDETKPHLHSFQIVEGKVIQAVRHQNHIYLNFGQNWREDFTIRIQSQDNRKYFSGKLDPLTLHDKTIRVRGWLKEYNGPIMDIDHPARIEIIQ